MFGIEVRFTLYWKNLVLMIFPRQGVITDHVQLELFHLQMYNYIQCS